MSSDTLLRDQNPVPTGIIRRIHLPQKLRNREAWFLIYACIIGGAAIALVQLGTKGTIEMSTLLFISSLWVPAVSLHLFLRAFAREADPFLLPITTALNSLGLAMIYRIELTAPPVTGWTSITVRQMTWTIIAVVAAIFTIILIRNHRSLLRFTYLVGLSGLVLLLSPLLPIIGREINGARVWLGFGIFSFQPAEIAKIMLAIFFAGYLVSNRDSLAMVGRKFLGLTLPRGRDLGPIIVVWLVAMAIIIFERDLGTALLLFGMFLVMIYVATARLSWVLFGLLLIAGGAYAASRLLNYVNDRFTNWLNPFDPKQLDAVGGSYQVVQGLFGLANGGLIGTGLGEGHPDITPLSQSDYIISSLGEELGLAGIFAILGLYILLVARGFRIGFAGQDDFGKLLAIGLGFVVALQVFIVVGGVTRVIPLTGLTTPFLAAGGSSLVANWIIIALLLRISDTVRKRPRLVVEP